MNDKHYYSDFKNKVNFDSQSRVACTNLLTFLFKLGIKSADPMAMYGGSSMRLEQVTQMLQSGLISENEAKQMLGFPGSKYV